MPEKFPVDMSQDVTLSVLTAMAILDFQTGDEWAGFTEAYADAHTDDAIQLLERHGLVPTLPEHQRKYIHNWMWGETT